MDFVGITKELHSRFVTTICTEKGVVDSCIYPKFYIIPKDIEVQIGIDQSTSESGLYVKNYKTNEFICVLNFKNHGLTPKEYTKMFKNILSSMLTGAQVRRLVYESHEAIGNNRYSSRVLKDLADAIKDLKYTCNGLANAEILTEKPNAWRSAFIPKERYSGNYNTVNVKHAVVQECLLRYPFLKDFQTRCSESYDSFEAIGILDGHLERNYTKEGIRIVTKSLEIERNHLSAKYFEKWRTDSDIQVIIAKYAPIIQKRDVVYVIFNPELTIEENSRRMTSNTNKVVLMNIPKTEISALVTWETGVRLQEGETFMMVCYRADKKSGAMLHAER